MKIKYNEAILAILDLTIEMSAKNMAFQEFITTYICENDLDASKEALKEIHKRADDNINLIRAKLLQYSEISEDDLLNGQFDV